MPARDGEGNRRKRREESGEIRRVPPGTFRAGPASRPDHRRPDHRREPERPALAMVLAPLLGIAVWVAIVFLLMT